MISSLRAFAWKDLFAYKTRFFIGVASLLLGTAFALILLVFMSSLESFAAQKTTESMGVDEVLVTPTYTPGFLGITKNIKRPLDQEALTELKNIPGVESVRVENIVEYPTSLYLSIFNTDFETDAAMFGIADEQFDTFATRKLSNPEHIPVLVSKELIDVYNVGIAQAIRKPLINEEFLRGFSFDVRLGYSSFFRDERPANSENRKAEIVGVVSGIPIVGVTTRFSIVEDINKRLLADQYTPTFVKVYLKLAPTATYEQVKSTILSKNFDATSFEEKLGPLRSQMSYLHYILAGVIGIVFSIIALTIFYLFYTQYVEKRYTLAVVKTLGATTFDIIQFFGFQAAILCLFGIGGGLVVGSGIIVFMRNLLDATLGNSLTGIAESVVIQPEHLLQVTALAAGLCLLCVAIPTWLAERLKPQSVLADH